MPNGGGWVKLVRKSPFLGGCKVDLFLFFLPQKRFISLKISPPHSILSGNWSHLNIFSYNIVHSLFIITLETMKLIVQFSCWLFGAIVFFNTLVIWTDDGRAVLPAWWKGRQPDNFWHFFFVIYCLFKYTYIYKAIKKMHFCAFFIYPPNSRLIGWRHVGATFFFKIAFQ